MKKLLAIFLILSVSAYGQKKITVEDLYQKGTFRTESVYGINWMQDGRFYTSQQGNQIIKSDISSGDVVETMLDGATLDEDFRFTSYKFSPDERKLLLLTDRQSIYRRSYVGEYFLYDIETKKAQRLSGEGKQSYATFSPDGKKVAFVRANDLYYYDLETDEEIRVTNDGEFNHIINGSCDWVYEEEFGFAKAFFWSPDSEKLAYYKFDESMVREYNMQVWDSLYPTDYRFKYPKAGERNSDVQILVYNLLENKHVKMNIGAEDDIYVPRVKWAGNSDLLSIKKLNRLQNHLQLFHADVKTGNATIVLEEKSDTYVAVEYNDELTYLQDGKHFIHTNENTGFKHLYLYKMNGELVRQLTNGDWEVTNFYGIDESNKRKWLYFLSTEESPTERHFYRVDLSGKRKEKLTSAPGMHSVNMSGDLKYYLLYHSDVTMPMNVSLFQTDGNKKIKQLVDNQKLVETWKEYNIGNKELFTVQNDVGDELYAYWIKPADFDENKVYPLLIFQYSGPGSQQVTNSFEGGHFYWHQMLAQQGYVVAVVDPRGTGGRGAAFRKQTYKQLGKLESDDLIAAAKRLGEMNFIDEERIGIWGWSFGGYASSLSLLKGNDVFKMAIAVAPVTNWRYYDTIYTERYMSTPQENPDGYDDNSPTSYADRLKGSFLLIHGTGDDNVHFQNAVELQDALIAAGKQFDSFYYPDRAHGIYRNNARIHLFNLMTDWVKENL
ncbi:MAG: S9 family peptidase [Candidatus Cyclobacteriaceae bacterium M2_1C_046]